LKDYLHTLSKREKNMIRGDYMVEQILLVFGAAIFGVLGTLHLYYTFFTNKFMTRDRKVAEAMQGTSPVLTSQTSIWNAWIGFNASHSLGALVIATFYILLATTHMEVIHETKSFSLLSVLIGICYLYLAKKYWFRVPFICILIATTCFVASALLIYK
jgi:hypothetical protein